MLNFLVDALIHVLQTGQQGADICKITVDINVNDLAAVGFVIPFSNFTIKTKCNGIRLVHLL